jgi:hypothetical protein
VFLIEDLHAYYSRRKRHDATLNNRAFKWALDGNVPKAKHTESPFAKLADRETIEDQLLQLQLETGDKCRVNMTKSGHVYDWIRTFTEQIASAPELLKRRAQQGVKFGESGNID